jgi:hypothetical protein
MATPVRGLTCDKSLARATASPKFARRKKKGPGGPMKICLIWPASARADPSVHAESEHEPCGQSRAKRAQRGPRPPPLLVQG